MNKRKKNEKLERQEKETFKSARKVKE